MLILSRKLGESIIIDGHIKVKVLGFQGGSVRIGIDAPTSIIIHREEIQDRIDVEKSNEEG